MNAIVTLESILTPAAVPLSAETLFGTGQIETIVSAIETQVRGEVIDITTAAGREAAKSLAHKVARSKGILDEIGKDHVAEIKAKSGKIDAERKTIRDRLDALKAEVRGPVERWEEADEKRVRAIEATLVCIIESPTVLAGASPHSIRDRIAAVTEYTTRDWQEFKERADTAITETLPKLNAMLGAAEQRERDAAELEALRAEKVARDARDATEKAAREQQERAERERQAQAERDRIATEQAAERNRRHAEQLETMKREQEALAKTRADEAAARAVEQERQRVAAEQAQKAAADQKRADNKRRRDKVHAAIKESIVASGVDAETADLIVAAMADGDIPHVSITY
ncbi:hypothetical protein [Bradyrhizobium sp. OK095]|uniref:hypothetical protein n=1 Tax=Bradyrhizobium sp. OK095 TaxID=1882760 RepID=UPI0008C30A82|nr:hypothetical protein [Bradyrhizobium sp. OK095]SEN67752.1 hypothetical protein SAMN05443254_11054 [Bradyrhizobium sp. OK095]